ncbi:ribbon-helix-helix protein, CopG family [Cyanobium sp. FACHB-13342]|uniref:ribbon-helix-helix protein, CopG family n=1 Tax=Cyanobium sp. FACHB-13342 TaxID=2692793 RepID=UPI001681A367|nr:ribbon-helix-helix protein, CopG family [Cyanobium sp. FACHB-13342]MBD2423173.1 ribbon-helix-helix protein, CopG family [Cyanobium sp. FACHB-13342]
MAGRDDPRRRRFSLELPVDLLDKIDGLKAELGLRSRGDLVERLLEDLFPSDNDASDGSDANAAGDLQRDLGTSSPTSFNEQGALVLVTRGAGGELTLDLDESDDNWADPTRITTPQPRQSGIDLPGFVRRQSDQLKRSLHPRQPDVQASLEPLPQVGGELIAQALVRARTHWMELYGNDANEAVLEAAMVWLAQDIWPQSDQSDNRPFTWSLACDVVGSTAPSWGREPASFERVMVMAGLLEDPFSTSTLELRLPTLIRRFVHRFRKRRKGTSFQTLEHTMTLHGALKLLKLPTAPGHRLTLGQIRDAYRDLAMSNHPDAGGSEDSMRRLNEAYQLLKELYRNK